MSDGEEESKEDFPLPPPPPGLTIPPLPTPPPPQDIVIDEESEPDLEVQDSDVDDDFKSAWAKRRAENPDLSSDKRDQMYGHIDRIATGEVGTLLDRFSDRFGSELDREIIVLRKKQQTDYEEEIDYEEELDESGSELEAESTSEDNDENQFVEFFSVVNDLLGSMPDDFVNSFVESDDFSLFQSVGNDPMETDEEARKEFFLMINRVLGDLPDDKINEFVQSPGFTIFQSMGEIYGS